MLGQRAVPGSRGNGARNGARTALWTAARFDELDDEARIPLAFAMGRPEQPDCPHGILTSVLTIQSPGNVWMAGPTPELTAWNRPALHIMALYAFNRVRRLVGPSPFGPQPADASITSLGKSVDDLPPLPCGLL